MLLGARAWEELTLVVFGRKPLLPMQIEQWISKAYPSGEVRLESFEHYEDALDYTKSARDVGFFFLVNDAKSPSILDIFDNLSKAYQTTGWKAFAAVVQPSPDEGSEAPLLLDKRILKYVRPQAISDPERCREFLDQTWNVFIENTVNDLLPGRTIAILTNLAAQHSALGSVEFRETLYQMFTPRLDLSWREMIGIRWAPIVNTVAEHNPAALEQQTDLMGIFGKYKPTQVTESGVLDSIAAKKGPLSERLVNLFNLLDNARIAGSLESLIKTIEAKATPGSPVLFRHIKENKSNILAASEERLQAA